MNTVFNKPCGRSCQGGLTTEKRETAMTDRNKQNKTKQTKQNKRKQKQNKTTQSKTKEKKKNKTKQTNESKTCFYKTLQIRNSNVGQFRHV